MPIFLRMACEDIGESKAKLSMTQVVFLIFPVALILGSYAFIPKAALKSKSMAGCKKTLGTCGDHLFVVSLFIWLSHID
jgi:olfactory receptor